MNCKKCGNLLNATDLFCQKCGEKVSVEPVMNNNIQPAVVQNNRIDAISNNVNTNMPHQSIMQQPFVNNQNVALQNSPEPIHNTNNIMTNVPEPMYNINQNNIVPNNQEVMNNLNQSYASPNVQETMPNFNQNINNNQTNQNFGMNPQPEPYMQPQNNIPQKKKTPFLIIVGVLFAIIVILAVVLLSRNVFNQNGEVPSTNNNNNNSVSDSINNGNTNTNVIEYKNFALPIPDKYTAEIDDGLITFINETDKIVVGTQIVSGYTVEDIASELDEIKSSFNQAGMTINSTDTKTIAGSSHIVIEGTLVSSGQTINTVIFYSGLGSYYVTQTELYNVGNSVSNDTILETFANVYKNTTYNGSSQFSGSEEKEEIPTDKINKLDLTKIN